MHMRIIDTHAHYDDEQFDADRDALLGSLPEKGIERIVNMGASPEGARASLALAKKYDHVYAGIGIHPDHVGSLSEAVMEELEELCRDPKVVAFGEIGLDYHWDVEPRPVQQQWFIRQLHLAKKLDLPVNIHSREAAQDTFDIMKREHAGEGTGIIHCFSGSAEMAEGYVKMGYSIGIGGVVTFKNAKTLKEVVRRIPIEYLVTETDCPYMAPTPFRGKRNDSGHLPLVVAQIAAIKGMPEEEAAAALYQNARRIYRWPDTQPTGTTE